MASFKMRADSAVPQYPSSVPRVPNSQVPTILAKVKELLDSIQTSQQGEVREL